MSSTGRRLRAWAVPITFIALSAVIHFLFGVFHPSVHAPTEHVDSAPLPVTLYNLARPSPTPTPKRTPKPSPRVSPSQAPTTHVRAIKNRRLTAARARSARIRIPAASSSPLNAGAASAPPAHAESTPLPAAATTEAMLPAPAAAPTPLDARDMIVAAEFVHRAPLRYPEIAKDAGWQGTVMILLTIGPNGIERTSIGASSGHAVLDRAALVAAKESTYRSPEVNGRPAVETYRVIYTFSLDS